MAAPTWLNKWLFNLKLLTAIWWLSAVFILAENDVFLLTVYNRFLGENNKKVRDLQDGLLRHLKPFKDKLYEIADERGNSGFHPLAPQVRFVWILKKYEPTTATTATATPTTAKTDKAQKSGS